MDTGTRLLELMHDGGWVMWALLVFSIVALATAVERGLALRRARIDLEPYVARLAQALFKKKSVAEALAVSGEARGPVARVAEAGLRRFDGTVTQLEKVLERRAQSELRRLQRGLGILASTAGTAPLLGFLGTVTGMMISFEALWQHGTGDPGMVALGIKEALTTTAAGLMVAVPAQLVYNTLMARVHRITGDVEAVASFLLEAHEELA